MKILFTGGGTGGHVIPIIAIAREITRKTLPGEVRFFYVGPEDEYTSLFLSGEGFKVKGIWAGKIRRYLTMESIIQNLIDILIKIPISILQSIFHLFFIYPDIIISKGGYGSLPVAIAGWILRVPLFLHESDITPGLTNKILNKFAAAVFVSFPKTEYFSTQKMILVGNPIRREILEGTKEEGKIRFKISGEKPVILILGGSQGAERINDAVILILPQLLKEFELIHQVGYKNFQKIKSEAEVILGPLLIEEEKKEKTKEEKEEKESGEEKEKRKKAEEEEKEKIKEKIKEREKLKKYYHLYPFIKETDLKHAFQICDLVVSRAGAGTIFEIAAVSKPSILIPLMGAAQNHQLKNAYAYVSSGAALVIEESTLTPHFFLEKLRYLFSHLNELKLMAEKAKEFSRPRAAKIIASYVVDYLLLAGV